MARELMREKIILDESAGHETTQVLMEGDLIVPDVKPDMSVMLQTDARVSIDRTELSTDRVNFIGRLELQVLYLAKGSEKPVHNMSLQANIDDFINMEGITKEMWVDAQADIANIDYKMVNDRKINYRAVINIHISAEKSNVHQVVVNISDIPENQLLKSDLQVNRSLENIQDRFIVKDEIAVPSGKPNIRELLQTDITVANKDVRLANGRANITGEIFLTTLYKGDSEDSIIEFMECEIPFNGVVEAPSAREDMYADIVLHVQDQYIQVRPDQDGEDRVIEAEISIGVKLKVHSAEKIEILEDAYCINQQLLISKTPVKFPRLICRNRNQATIKEIVQIDGHCPDILQIFQVKGRAKLDDIKVIDDKVIVEGIIDADVLYVAESDDTPLYSLQTTLPYRQVIETKDAKPDMNVGVDISVDHVTFNMLSGREIELRFLLSFHVHVTEEKEMNIITDIDFLEMDKEVLDGMASMTVYVVQKGDTLWKIAKKYNTEIDELLSVNEIEDPNKIYPGQKLLILKKIA